MAIDRRQLLAGLGIVGLTGAGLAVHRVTNKSLSNAQENSQILSGAKDADGYAVYAIEPDGLQITYKIASPERLHGFARNPQSNHVVAFARRPGDFAVIFDIKSGEVIEQITSLRDRHFYGHGTYSLDGNLLFATENAYQTGAGQIGVYDASANYRKIGELSSGGIGPHEMRRLNQSNTLVVANSGVRTHPDTGRSKLNVETMRSSLAYIDASSGRIIEQQSLVGGHHQLSIRHLDVSAEDEVAFAMQFFGSKQLTPDLFGVHRQGEALQTLTIDAITKAKMHNYTGSICFAGAASRLIVSAPKGNGFVVCQMTGWRSDLRPNQPAKQAVQWYELIDGCGVLTTRGGELVFSGGAGDLQKLTDAKQFNVAHNVNWDNHLG